MTPAELDHEVRQLELGTRRLVRNLVAGEYASAFRGRGVEFADVREYQVGDDVRTIDWRVTARLGTMYVRRYREERDLTLVLAVDCSASGTVGSDLRTKRELATRVAAVLALAAARSNDRIGALLFTDRVERFVAFGKGRRHALRVVRELLAFTPAGRGTSLRAAVDFLDPVLRHRAAVVLLSDFESADAEGALARLSGRHDVIAAHLTDRIEQTLPAVGLLRLWDPESGEWRLIDSSSPAVRAHLAQAQRAADAALTRLVFQSGADLLRLDASVPFAEPLLEFFRHRSRRR